MAGTDELDVGSYGGGGGGVGGGGGGGNFSSPPTVPGPTSSPSTHNDAEVDKEATAAAATAAAVAVDGGLFSTSQMVLWVPHATIALLLIGLVTASFVRFHSKHGHKYRKPSNPAAGSGGGGGGLASREAPATAWGMQDQDNAIVDLRGVLDGGQSPVTMDASGGTTMAMTTPGRTPPPPPPLSPTTNPPLDPHPPLDDDAGAVQIDWWDSGLTPCSSSASAVAAESPLADCRAGENSGRLQSSSGGVCNPVESGGRRGGAGAGGGGGGRGGGGLEAPRALFSVWTLRRGRVGDIVCLPKAISKPLRVSAGDCTTDECHELLLEKL